MTPTAERHLIKKYANRKLYDTRTSRYITLAGISELVRQGQDIQVLDRESGRDLTPVVLSQLVTSEERRNRPSDSEPDGSDGLQERGQALLDYVRRTLNIPGAIVTGEVEKRVGDVEAVVDLAIERALRRLNIPTRNDIDRLTRRVNELSKRIDGSPPARARSRASATTKSRRRKGAA
jgi:hypothetical protein